ncbi:MAG: hypothetical protein ACFFG0_01470 [Candidatus Thorarchaeota archaeon]
MKCICKIENLSDFPEEWKYVLLTIKTKEEMRDRLQETKVLNIWSQDITRLTQEIGYLLTGLPKDIKEQYLRIRLKEKYLDKWRDAVAKGDNDEIEFWLFKYRNVFKYCDGGLCECRKNNNG